MPEPIPDLRLDAGDVGDLALMYLGEDVEEVRVRPDAHYDHLELVVCLYEDSWSAREVVIDRMVTLRQHLFSDWSIEYAFGDAGVSTVPYREDSDSSAYVAQRELVSSRS